MKKLFLLQHFIIATIVTYVAACIMQTQMVLLALSNLNIEITWSKRIYMTSQDLLGLMPTYVAIIALGLAIGFAIAKAIRTYSRFNSYSLYVAAGGFTMAAILVAMQPVLGVTLLAGARSAVGIMLQIIAGVLGGLCFMRLRKTYNNK
ncbi:MAG: hypothetical protein ACJA0G_001931 [Kangiellaceae bacterium]|jgi:hypothetical protein